MYIPVIFMRWMSIWHEMLRNIALRIWEKGLKIWRVLKMQNSVTGNAENADIILCAEEDAAERSFLMERTIVSIFAKHIIIFLNMRYIKWNGYWQNKNNLL